MVLSLPYLFGFQGVFAITVGRAASPFSLALTWQPGRRMWWAILLLRCGSPWAYNATEVVI